MLRAYLENYLFLLCQYGECYYADLGAKENNPTINCTYSVEYI